jgi:polyisoprenoid-binding protein YceI
MGLLAVVFALLQAAGGGRYVVDGGASRVTIEVGRAGLFKFAGHEHTVTAEGLSGEVVVDTTSVERSSVRVVFSATAVRVTASDGPADDIPKIQATMAGTKVLDVERFPEILFSSTAVSGRKGSGEAWDITVAGELDLHGVRRRITAPLRVTPTAEALVAEGIIRLRQRDYGIEPVSVGGVVKVKDELVVTLKVVARPVPP